jgi:hypothetical protein
MSEMLEPVSSINVAKDPNIPASITGAPPAMCTGTVMWLTVFLGASSGKQLSAFPALKRFPDRRSY